MMHNGGTVQWKVGIGCHGRSVVIVTSQMSLFHEINSFRVISFLL